MSAHPPSDAPHATTPAQRRSASRRDHRCQTAEGTLRFTTAEDMERYIGMLPNVRSQNFRCFCTEWIFGANLVE